MAPPKSPKCALRGGLTRDEVKAAVRERDGGKCTACGMTDAEHVEKTGKRCEVHRKVPGSVYTVEGCVLLCRGCHDTMPKRNPGETDDEARNGFMVRLPEDHRAALDEVRKKTRRTITTEIQIALEKHYRDEGVKFPPSSSTS